MILSIHIPKSLFSELEKIDVNFHGLVRNLLSQVDDMEEDVGKFKQETDEIIPKGDKVQITLSCSDSSRDRAEILKLMHKSKAIKNISSYIVWKVNKFIENYKPDQESIES